MWPELFAGITAVITGARPGWQAVAQRIVREAARFVSGISAPRDYRAPAMRLTSPTQWPSTFGCHGRQSRHGVRAAARSHRQSRGVRRNHGGDGSGKGLPHRELAPGDRRQPERRFLVCRDLIPHMLETVMAVS